MRRNAYEQIAPIWEHAGVPDLKTALEREILAHSPGRPSGEHPFSLLPNLCCLAAGGESVSAESVSAAWNILYLAAYLLDSAADGDSPDSESGVSITLAAACISSASLLLTESQPPNFPSGTALAIQRDFQRTILIACNGQVNDLARSTRSLGQCWQMVQEKTGGIYALASRSGARVATTNQETIRCFSDFGLHLGMLVQIGDDINGLWPEHNQRSDLFNGRWSLPVAYTMEVSPESQRRQLQHYLRSAKIEPAAEGRAREIVIESGAMLYLVAKANWHFSEAEKSIRIAAQPGRARDQLLDLLAQALPKRGL